MCMPPFWSCPTYLKPVVAADLMHSQTGMDALIAFERWLS
jgi:hypothetical protein